MRLEGPNVELKFRSWKSQEFIVEMLNFVAYATVGILHMDVLLSFVASKELA